METKEKNKIENNGKTCSTTPKQEKSKRLSKAGKFMRKYGNIGQIVDMRAVLK